MALSDLIAVGQLGLALVTAVCGAVCWLAARFSAKARKDAQTARNEAQRTVQAAEQQAQEAHSQTRQLMLQSQALIEQAEQLARQVSASEQAAQATGRIADHVAPQQLTAVWRSRRVFVLRNGTPVRKNIEYLRNREQFVRLDGLPDGTSLEPGEVREIRALDTADRPMPSELVLDLVGDDSPTTVSLAGRPLRE